MDASTLYLPLKHAHVGLVTLSVSLFTLRGLGSLLGTGWPHGPLVRRGTVVIDTLLLATGATLWHLLGLNPTVQHWLGLKLALLLAYIVLGVIALRRGRRFGRRLLAYLAALAVVGAMIGIALAHDPAGWWRLFAMLR